MAAGDRINFSGDEINTAPTGGVTRGKAYEINSARFVVARETADAGEEFLSAVTGPVVMTKATGTGISFDKYDPVYVSSNQADVTGTGDEEIGWAMKAAGISDTTVEVMLTEAQSTVS